MKELIAAVLKQGSCSNRFNVYIAAMSSKVWELVWRRYNASPTVTVAASGLTGNPNQGATFYFTLPA